MDGSPLSTSRTSISAPWDLGWPFAAAAAVGDALPPPLAGVQPERVRANAGASGPALGVNAGSRPLVHAATRGARPVAAATRVAPPRGLTPSPAFTSALAIAGAHPEGTVVGYHRARLGLALLHSRRSIVVSLA